MIRTVKQLEAAVARGETVSVMAVDASPGKFRTCITSTGETVFRSAIRALHDRGVITPIRLDLCDEPMQWGRA